MAVPDSFKAASKAAESWVARVSLVATLGKLGNVDEAYNLLAALPHSLQDSYKDHAETLETVEQELSAISDGPVKWETGRGRSSICEDPTHVYPHCWSSAHEAALGIADLALELLVSPLAQVSDPSKQKKLAEELLTARWKAVAMTADEVASLRERIRRERAKLLDLEANEQLVDLPEPPLKERVLDVLTGPQRMIIEYLWDCKHGVSFDTLLELRGAYRDGNDPSDSTLRAKIKAMRNRIAKARLPVVIEESGRRLKIVLLPG